MKEPSAGEREGVTPRKKQPSAGEREGVTPRKKQPSAGEREGVTPRKKQPSAGEREGVTPRRKPELPTEDPLYPSSDGLPLAENDWQLTAILGALDVLRGHFEDHPDIYVSGDLLIYYEEGNPAKSVAPDVFVVLGAPRHNRMTYKLWEEPKAPDFVLEVASQNTWKQDVGPKRALYAELGIQEYWMFDPKDEYFDPPLQGLTLQDGTYGPLPARVEKGRRTLSSAVLGMDLWIEDGNLRFRDAATGEVFRTWSEHRVAHRQEQAAREREQAAREREQALRRQEREREQVARLALEARVRELEARLREAESR